MIGTSDQSCWLAEACKILLLLLLLCRVGRVNYSGVINGLRELINGG